MKVPIDEVLRRTGEFFMGTSEVHRAATKIAKALTERKIPFAIAGALAVFAQGHRRSTGDVNLLMTREGLAAFKAEWLGRGWVEKFAGSKGVRDPENNVTIDVLLAGEYPGDGKPKPVVFPDPAVASESGPDGVPVLRLNVLIDLKLASGMSSLSRLKDLADVIALIVANRLPRDYASQLNEYVRAKFDELWLLAQIDEDY